VSLTSSSTVNVEGRISVTHLEWSCCFVMLVGPVSILVLCVVENIDAFVPHAMMIQYAEA
jgi:hypothetical protein